jgi:DNA-directed RNA polymerase subunit alpha
MLPLPKNFKLIEKKENKALFKIEPLYPGYGTTLGNALRRVLYSSLPGAAITQVKIKGVEHEFSTIPYVLEDVLNITLNLKKIRFKFYGETPEIGKLKVKGEKKVKAKDFKFSANVKVVNKEAHIATLTDKKAQLEMEVQVEKGLGYLPREIRKKTKLEIGTIQVDAIFTPIKRVKFEVENMRVGERTDYDRLFLEIETDGTINPEQTLVQAAEILVNHFELVKTGFAKTKA